MAQTNAQVAARFTYTGTKGGAQERNARLLLNAHIELGKMMETLMPDGAEKDAFFSHMDTAVTQVHSAATKLNDKTGKPK